ncbi:response regulator receiver modulated diguanylate cyclase/phosphodiesterase with PAS/PAC sensor(s) [Oceanobacillus limi]|uniref:Response regulator receiver modulated diguanylate cyclase/phosphodiesterase with PAS/PAC sensor(S) n=1 Tax=Oceanobacillus limi TaxID=930131 RepID=A0A1I0BHN8_9BACI|nr:EAL domain-containing protein [Oceanobacillus limi]SET06413.1 response regulator receiver modulated diguanylate cyclase/phosphodiesterase with PAS/PAC sensor(s) [Oceanobacillus limi]
MSQPDKINILLVDDRPENLLSIEAIIEKDEYNLVKASSGEEALKFLLKYNFALILLDVQMPDMDGFSTAKIIKAREKTKDIPILFITANNMESEHIFMGYSVGAIDYILKPVDPLILKSKVEGFVDIYKLKQQLIQQASMLNDQKNALEKANLELTSTTEKLRISEALANVISETSIDSMIVLDEDGVIQKINPSVQKTLQYTEKDIIGSSIYMVFSEEDAQKYMQDILQASKKVGHIEGYEKQKELMITKKDGSTFLAEVQIGLKKVNDTLMFACTIRDITDQKKNEEMIKYMAYHDILTDLPDRRSWNVQLPKQIKLARKQNQSLGVMILNMDRFKYINDSLGHVIGDQILQEIANRLMDTVRKEDLVARIGGDEFGIILPNTDRESALLIAEKIIEAFQLPFFINNYELFITTSIGLSVFPYDGEDYLELIKNSHAALYRAKERGKNNYNVFHSGMNMQTYRSFSLQNDLRRAIEREEFELHYQPRVNIETGKVESAEALIRWNHPSWGLVPPLEFIPLAEETGQIVEIGDWVVKTVCEQINTWKQEGIPPIRIAINFSSQQFLQKDLADMIQRILESNDVHPELIEIEITESVVVENEENSTKTLQQLSDMGICISIDDFGTGYSSLHYLSRLPVNTLKIDKSFIQKISSDKKQHKLIITSIVSLAKALNMHVIAEGVETENQLDFLRNQECEEVQGYLFSKPIVPNMLEEILVQGDYKIDIFKNNNPKSPAKLVVDTPEPIEKQQIIRVALQKIQEQHAISSRELEVFDLILAGLSNKEISEKLYISEHTVKNHISRIFQKLNVNDRAQAMAMVYQICINEG